MIYFQIIGGVIEVTFRLQLNILVAARKRFNHVYSLNPSYPGSISIRLVVCVPRCGTWNKKRNKRTLPLYSKWQIESQFLPTWWANLSFFVPSPFTRSIFYRSKKRSKSSRDPAPLTLVLFRWGTWAFFAIFSKKIQIRIYNNFF